MSALRAKRALSGDYFDFTVDAIAQLHAISAQLYAAATLLDLEDDSETLHKIGDLIRTADIQVGALVDVIDNSTHTYTSKEGRA